MIPNNVQFGGAQDDFQTEKPLVNDPLNVSGKNAGELNDTDDFREDNFNNDVQEIMEDMANDPQATLSEDYIKEQEEIAQEAFDKIYQLGVISKRISARGMSTKDYMALESIVPGIFSKVSLESNFSYNPSQSNVVISQETITENIKAFVKQAYEALHKLIVLIINKMKDLSQKYVSGKMKAIAVKFRTLRAKNTDALQMSEFQRLSGLSDEDAINKLRECGLERLASTLKAKPEDVVAVMKSVKTGASPVDVVNILGNAPGRVPALMSKGATGIGEMLSLTNNIVSTLNALLDQANWEAGMIGEDYNLSKFGAKLNYVDEISGKHTELRELSNVWSVLDLVASGQLDGVIQSITKALAKADNDMKSFWSSLKGDGKDNTSVFKEFRAKFYETLRKAQDILNEIEATLRVASVTALFSGAYVTKFAKGLAKPQNSKSNG